MRVLTDADVQSFEERGYLHVPAASDPDVDFMTRRTEVRGVPLRVVELCGAPGDVVFCSPGIFHAVNHNRADVPRIMRVKFMLTGEA